MVVSHAFRSDKDRDIQVVSIVSVDPVGRTATGLTRIRTTITINCSYGVGEVTVTPAQDEQWYVERHEREWRLYGRVPFNDSTLLTEPKEGQVNVGGAKGPLELFGTTINAHAPIALTPFDAETLPAADSVAPGAVAYAVERDVPIVSDGTNWNDIEFGREPAIDPGETTDYWRGDKTWQPLDKAAVGLGNVDDTSDVDKPISTATQAAIDALTIDDISGIVEALGNKTDTTILTTKGDLYVASAPNVPARLGVGSSGQALLSDASAPLGVKWGTIAGSSGTVDASAITGGPLSSGLIPGLDASKIISGVLAQTLVPALSGDWTGTIASSLLTGVLTEALIPSLTGDWSGTIAASLLLGVLDQTLIPALTGDWEGSIAASVLTGILDAAHIGGLNASKIVDGILSQTLIPALTGDWSGTIAASLILGVLDQTLIPALTGDWEGSIASSLLTGLLNTTIIPGLDASKIITGVLSGTLIPNLAASIITSGTFAVGLIPNLAASIITSGIFTAGQIPGLDASKIITGVLSDVLIPALPASIITTGTLLAARIPNLPASIINSGTFVQSLIPSLTTGWGGTVLSSFLSGTLGTGLIPGLDASKIITGVLGGGLIPSLPASQITSGIFTQGLIPSLTGVWGGTIASSLLSGVLGTSIIPGLDASKIVSGVLSGTLIPNLNASIITAGTFAQSLIPSLTTGWGGTVLSSFLSGTLGTGLIPGLDASKIITGVFPQSMVNITSIAAGLVTGALTAANIPNLDVAKITTGVFGAGFIPGLDVSKIITGTFGTGFIPNLDVAKITTGVFGTGFIPSLPAAQITSGTFGAGLIPGLDVSKIITGVFGTGFIPSLDVAKITTGIFGAGFIPGLDAAKIISGTFANAMSPGLLPQSLWQTQTTAGKNLVISPDFEDSTITRETGIGVGASVAYSTDVANSGTQSIKFTGSNSLAGAHSDVFYLAPNTVGGMAALTTAAAIKVQQGHWFYSEIYVRAKATNTATAGSLTIYSFLKNSTTGAATLFALSNVVAMAGLSSSAWTKISGWAQIPAGYDLLFPFVWQVSQDVANQVFYWDDARIVEETVSQSVIQQLFGGSSILSTILAGTVPGLDAAKIITGTFANAMSPGLAPIDTLVQAFGGAGIGHTLADLTAQAQAITPVSVAGTLGGSNIGATVQNVVDGFINGLTSGSTANNAIAQVQTTLNTAMAFLGWTPAGVATPPSSVAAITSKNDAATQARAVQKQAFENLDPTLDSTFPLSDVWLNATLPVIALTQANSVMGDITIRDGNPTKQAVTFRGYPTGGTFASISDFRINVFSVNQTTNVRTLVHSSVNYVGLLPTGTTPQFVSYNLPSSIVTAQGDKLTAELTMSGSGTYNVVGQTISSQVGFHPTYGLHGLSRARPAPVFDALGAGFTRNTTLNPVATTRPTLVSSSTGASFTTANTPNPLTWTENIAATANCIVVPVAYYISGGTAITATCGGVAMTAIGNFTFTANNGTQFFYLMNPPTGNQTISIVVTGGTWYVAANSMSFTGVGAVVQTGAGASGNSAAISQTYASNTGQTLVNAMSSVNVPVTFSAYNQNQITNIPGVSGAHYGLVSGWAAGAASVTFSATPSVSNSWGSSTIALDGITQIGTVTHNGTAGAAAILTVGVNGPVTSTDLAFFRRSATYDGVPMTSLGSLSVSANGTNTYGWVEMFGIASIPGGSKTVAFNISGGTTGTATAFYTIEANVESWTNVASFGTALTGGTHAGGGSLTSGAITTAPAPALIANAFFSVTVPTIGAITDSAYSATSRWNQSVLNATVNTGSAMLLGEAAGGASVTITATATPAGSTAHANISVPLNASFTPPTTLANPTSLVSTPVAWSLSVPWIGLSGVAAATQYSPVLMPFPASGTFDPTLYPWANYFDRITCGAGGGGSGGNATPSGGTIGIAGSWSQDTLTKAQAGSSLWTITAGAGGAGGAAYGNGGGTGGTSIIATPGQTTLTGAGGAGAGAGTVSASGYGQSPGQSPGNLVYNDHNGQQVTIAGGAGGGFSGTSGSQPGGSGAGGNSSFVGGGGTTGGNGGAGEAFIRIYQ